MTPENPVTDRLLRRRQVMRAAGGRRAAGHLQSHLAGDLHGEGGGQPAGFEYAKYSGWAEKKESLMTGRIQAAYMLAPLVMDLADHRIPLKIVSLGHRSGAVIMVRTDSAFRNFADLRGKLIAIPSRFAVGSTTCSCARCWPAPA